MQSKAKTHHSLEKALDLLQVFNPFNQELGTLEIAAKAGLHRSTASRLLRVLNDRGFLARDSKSKKYSLGPAVAQLAHSLNRSLNSRLVRIAAPYLEKLRNQVGETVVLEQLKGDHTIIVYVAEGPGPVFLKGSVGNRRALHAAGGGKAILANSPPELVQKILSEPLEAFTRNTVTDPEKLRSELVTIKNRGFAFDREETNHGINAIGVPILGPEGSAIAAVVVAGGTQTVSWRKGTSFVPSMLEASQPISDQLV